ncbi:hypothetical protein ISR92_02855 [Patescibacteria group bacterium]|nr:hypothetical protein [Patescibacteria group bacterium]
MKYLSGFVPVNFNFVGKILLILGLIILILKIVSLTIWLFNMPGLILFIGVCSIIIGIYLIYIVPKID